MSVRNLLTIMTVSALMWVGIIAGVWATWQAVTG